MKELQGRPVPLSHLPGRGIISSSAFQGQMDRMGWGEKTREERSHQEEEKKTAQAEESSFAFFPCRKRQEEFLGGDNRGLPWSDGSP